MIKRQLGTAILSVMVVSIVLLGIASAQITVDGEFNGTLGGYGGEGNGENLKPNEIAVSGQFTFKGEDAQNVRVRLLSGQYTVLDTSSVKVFVEGQEAVTFDRLFGGNRVILKADEVPKGTTIRINYATYFVGGTQAKKITASTVKVKYETEGGTKGNASFPAKADMGQSADNRIADIKKGERDSQIQEYLFYGAIGAIVGIIIFGVLKLRGDDDDTGPP